MVFVRQICDGILFMHKMRVLHLDLKVLGWGLLGGVRNSARPLEISAATLPPPLLLFLHPPFHPWTQKGFIGHLLSARSGE